MSGRLIHLNGAPGVGKSTLAHALVASRPGWLCLDIDLLRRLIGGWEDEHGSTGTLVRPLALAMISAHVGGGGVVVMPQLLVDPDELGRFVGAAVDAAGTYSQVLLDLPDPQLASRWRERDPSDPITAANNRVIAAHGGDAVVLDWARKVHLLALGREDVTVVELVGLSEGESLECLVSVIDGHQPPR